jgi:hypothetical protein
VGVGLVLIWIQVISWWEYDYRLLLVPMGLLATHGTETLWTALTGSMALLHAGGAPSLPRGSLLRSLRAAGQSGGTLSGRHPLRRAPFLLGGASLRSYRSAHDTDYADELNTTSFVREPGSVPGTIYAFGDPSSTRSLVGTRPFHCWPCGSTPQRSSG